MNESMIIFVSVLVKQFFHLANELLSRPLVFVLLKSAQHKLRSCSSSDRLSALHGTFFRTDFTKTLKPKTRLCKTIKEGAYLEDVVLATL